MNLDIKIKRILFEIPNNLLNYFIENKLKELDDIKKINDFYSFFEKEKEKEKITDESFCEINNVFGNKINQFLKKKEPTKKFSDINIINIIKKLKFYYEKNENNNKNKNNNNSLKILFSNVSSFIIINLILFSQEMNQTDLNDYFYFILKKILLIMKMQ